ncbi:MAG: flagellar biosynthetic protein FliP, partial [Mariprofundaceae bacterium]
MKVLSVFMTLFLSLPAMAAEYPSVQLSLGSSDNPGDFTTALSIVMVLTVLALAPSILVMMTSFTRILVVFAFLRQALGT